MSAPTVQLSLVDLAPAPMSAEQRIDFYVRAARKGSARSRMARRLTLLRMTRG